MNKVLHIKPHETLEIGTVSTELFKKSPRELKYQIQTYKQLIALSNVPYEILHWKDRIASLQKELYFFKGGSNG